MSNLTQQAYTNFSQLVFQRLGITLGDNKQYLVKSRLSNIMRDNQYSDLNALISDITTGKSRELQEAALFAMTTNETYWFRDEYPYHILSTVLLPKLFEEKRSIRIWSSACSTGQEPYSIAMAILEYQQRTGQVLPQIEILATDISQPVLSCASEGIYDSLSVSRGLSQQRLSQFFNSKNGDWQINNDIKQLVKFKQFNLLDSYSLLGTFDVIFCRNVLIYFNDETKQSILQKFSAQLPQGRFLFLGAAESTGISENLFKMEKQPQGLYYSRL